MIQDIDLRQAVLNELRWDTQVDATRVAVTTNDCVVTLTGYVDSYPDIFRIRTAVRRVHGVRAIADEMMVELPDEHVRDDTDIATSIALVLENSVTGKGRNVIAEVSQGIVSLRGEVDWQHEREHIQQQVSHVIGVRNVSNLMFLSKRPTSDNVKHEIQEALQRNAELESDHVTVTVVGDEVILEGYVKAFYERNLIEAAAWHAPGVHKVTDKIRVGLDKG